MPRATSRNRLTVANDRKRSMLYAVEHAAHSARVIPPASGSQGVQLVKDGAKEGGGSGVVEIRDEVGSVAAIAVDVDDVASSNSSGASLSSSLSATLSARLRERRL